MLFDKYKRPSGEALKQIRKENPIWEIFVPLFLVLFILALCLCIPYRDIIICDDMGQCRYCEYSLANFNTTTTFFDKNQLYNSKFVRKRFGSEESKNIHQAYEIQLPSGKNFSVSKPILNILEEYKNSDEYALKYNSYRFDVFIISFILLFIPCAFLFITARRIIISRTDIQKYYIEYK